MRPVINTPRLVVAMALWLALALALPSATAQSASTSAAAPDPLARIAAQVESAPLLRAEFTQTRQMAALKRPLVTSGRLVYSRQHGVLWEIDKPYRMTYVLGEDRVIEIGADGTRRERNARDLPGMAQVARVFRALLGAETAALRELFEVSLQGDTTAWSVALKPRQAQMAQALTRLSLSGGRFVETLRMDEGGGDHTLIRLQRHQTADAPSPAETKLFGGARP